MSPYLWFLLLPRLITGHPCAEALERQLDVWGVTSEVLRSPGGPLGGAVYRIATNELGAWVTVHQPRGLDVVSLFFTDATGSVRVDFDRTCEPESSPIFSAPTTLPEAFSDNDLKAALANDDRLIVFLWSPHLPLSVEGYHEITRAAAVLGVPLQAVVDGAANRGFVERVADAEGIPARARRPMSSVELLFRDLAVHTPSIIVFSGGRVSAPLPGFRNSDAYLSYLRTVLDSSGSR